MTIWWQDIISMLYLFFMTYCTHKSFVDTDVILRILKFFYIALFAKRNAIFVSIELLYYAYECVYLEQ